MTSYHIEPKDSLLHDYADAPDGYLVDALVASGDCFITLATQLDAISHNPAVNLDKSDAVVEDLIRTLIYLQRHYKVVKKAANYRQ